MNSTSSTERQIINDGAGWYTIKKNKGVVFYTLYTKNNLFTGKAVLDERDKWNPDFGKRLAKLRAIREMKQFKLDQYLTELDLANMYLNQRSYEILRAVYAEDVEVLRMSIRNLSKKIRDLVNETEGC